MPALSATQLARSALLVLPLLGACTALEPMPAPEPARQLTMERSEYRHSVYFETDRDRPSAEEGRRLAAFLQGLGPQARHSFRLAGHADDRASETYNVDLSARRARSVGELIRGWGFGDEEVSTLAFGERAPAQAGTSDAARSHNRRVDVIVDGWSASLPDCPDWSRDPAETTLNLPLSNLGCATLTNLGLMVADPADLARGRSMGPADGVREAEAIVRYRTDKTKALQDGLIEQ